MDTNHQFCRDYGGPASFYSLEAGRKTENSIFLFRNLHRKHSGQRLTRINLKIVSSVPAGKLAFTLLSVRDCGAGTLKINLHDSFEILTNEDRSESIVQLKTSSPQEGVLVIFVTFMPLKSKSKVLNQRTIFEAVLKSYLCSAKLKLDSEVLFTLLEVLSTNQNSSKPMPSRRNFEPISTGLATIKLNNARRLHRMDICVNVSKSTELILKTKKLLNHKPFEAYFHYLYLNGSIYDALVEKQSYFQCPWCSFRSFPEQLQLFEQAITLLNHLKCSHWHFEYDFFFDERNRFHVTIQRPKSLEQDVTLLPKDQFSSVVICSRSKVPEQTVVKVFSSASRLVNENGFSSSTQTCKAHVIPAIRQYYHARTGLPLIDEEHGVETGEDNDVLFEEGKTRRALEDFEDVSFEEKQFMQLWNFHIQQSNIESDSFAPTLYEDFVVKFHKVLLEKNLRFNFLLHLTGAWEFGLLRSDELSKIISVVDHFAALEIPFEEFVDI